MTPQQEESAARARERRLEQARKKAAEARARARASMLRGEIRETAEVYPACRCKIQPSMDNRQLRALGSGCTTHWVCPRLDRVRRRAGI